MTARASRAVATARRGEVAEHAPDELRGTALGLHSFGQGSDILVASTVAGVLWDAYGAPSAFAPGAAFALRASSRALGKRRPAGVAASLHGERSG